MSQEASAQHHLLHIARYAVEAGWLTWEVAMSWLVEVGQEYVAQGASPFDIWVRQHLLNAAQLDEALAALDVEAPPSAPPLPTISMLAPPPPTPARPGGVAAHQSHETLMTLPSAVILRQLRQREPLREPAERLDELSSEPVLTKETSQLRKVSRSHQQRTTAAFAVVYGSGENQGARKILAEEEAMQIPAADDAPTHDEPPAPLRPLASAVDPLRERYELGEQLGSGGGGRVVRAYDRVLGRDVAMKIMRPDPSRRAEQLNRFIAEAQTTGQLEHPNIVPIYDFGTLENGDAYYTMREVRNTSLRKALARVRDGDEASEEEFSLHRLVALLRQVCLAIHYAHVQGVVHRDLKPDNIMLGDYGEVLVMDWGLARHFERHNSSSELSLREEGQTLGTPAYMPPEQARGELAIVDELSDVYSLGAILYEILTLEPPYVGESPLDVMWCVVEGELVSPSKRAPFRDIPEELERICMRALAHRREARFHNAKDLYDALNDWSEGLQPREASRRTTDGEAWGRRYRMLLKESEALELRVRREAARIEAWEPIERKRALWALEDRLKRFHLESARAFGHAVAHFTQALVYMPGHDGARCGLADLYWARFEHAERQHDLVNALYFKALVAQYDDQGRYRQMLRDAISLQIQSSPPGATISLSKQSEEDRRLLSQPANELGVAPLELEDLPTGRYVLSAELPERPAVRLPMLLERGVSREIELPLPHASAYLEGFAFIPAGEFISGSDPQALNPVPEERIFLPSFFCAVFPVTFRQYLEWIDELHQQDPAEAQHRAPQLRGSEGFLVRFDEARGRWVPDEILIEGPARDRYPTEQGHEWDIPVVGVSSNDALAYAAWRAEKSGFPLRLLSAWEFEKAARGTDGRYFPWGDHFDATFCKMRSSRREPPQLEPIGAFPHDVSPYGIRDMAGGVQEWCLNDIEGAIDVPVRGGSWSQDMRACRLASRVRILAAARTGALGLRLAYSLDDLSPEQR